MYKKRILIIDDEEDFSKLVKKNIEKNEEYEVETAANGEEGIKLVQGLKPDLVLLDIIMPGMDGADVVAAIRNDITIKDTPVVFLTSIVREEESSSQPSFTSGYAILAKTATIGELMDCIKKNIRGSK